MVCGASWYSEAVRPIQRPLPRRRRRLGLRQTFQIRRTLPRVLPGPQARCLRWRLVKYRASHCPWVQWSVHSGDAWARDVNSGVIRAPNEREFIQLREEQQRHHDDADAAVASTMLMTPDERRRARGYTEAMPSSSLQALYGWRGVQTECGRWLPPMKLVLEVLVQ